MLDSYAGSDMLKRKTAEHEALKQWINADAKRKAEYAGDIEAVEKLIAQRDAEYKRDYNCVVQAAPAEHRAHAVPPGQ
jgi:hypothetical protein